MYSYEVVIYTSLLFPDLQNEVYMLVWVCGITYCLCAQNKVQVGDILDEIFGHPLKAARKSKVSSVAAQTSSV